MLTIQENPDYSIGILNNNSSIYLVMALVNSEDGRLIFKTEYKGKLSDFTGKYSDLIPVNTKVEVYLDLSVYVGSQLYHFATVTDENDLVNQFVKLGNEYPNNFTIGRDGDLTINLIEESTMKGILADTWDNLTLSSEDLQSKIDQLEASLNLSTLKLKTYKTTAAEIAIRGTEIPSFEKKNQEEIFNFLQRIYSIQLEYDALVNNVTLSTLDNKKYTAIKNMFRSGAAYYKLISGTDFPIKG